MKEYIRPQAEALEAQPAQILALSTKEGTADPEVIILVKDGLDDIDWSTFLLEEQQSFEWE